MTTGRMLFLLLINLRVQSSIAQIIYPGLNLPADTPALFAPGLLSDGLSNRDFTISPSGDELFFTIQHPKFLSSDIVRVKKVKGRWGKPEMAPFSGSYRDLEASFSADGNTLFFASDRPIKENEIKKDFDLWKVNKLSNGEWGAPVNLGPEVNTEKNEFYPSVARNGNLYFTVEAAYGKGGEDIVVCKKTASGYDPPVSLPENINSKFAEFNAFVDPDEQFIIFTSYGRSDDMGQGDLYISKKDAQGNWASAQRLPAPINSKALDYCPYVTPDKKYLVFSSNRLDKAWGGHKKRSYSKLKQLLSGPGNGLDDIYWVKFNKDW